MDIRIIEIIATGITAVYGVSIGFLFFLYLQDRNLYTQKILYLNEELKNLENREDFTIPRYKKFLPKRETEEFYPPIVIPRYYDNPTYKTLVERFKKRASNRDKLIKLFTIIFGILISMIGLGYMLVMTND